jgi:hypothetical protein
MNPLAIVQLVIVLIPLLTQLITWVEDLVKNSGVAATGADKKATVLALFQQMWTTLSTSGAGSKLLQIPADQLTSAVSQLIDLIVAGLNAMGIFTKAPATPTA